MDSSKHSPEPHPPKGRPPRDLNVTWTVVVGFVGAIFTFLFILGILILFQRTEQAEHYQKVVSEAPAELAQLRSQQLERISTYRLVSEKDQKAAIPVERAMELIVRDPGILASIAPPAEQSQPAGGTASGPTTQESGGPSQ